MPLNAQQLVANACITANGPGYISTAGQFLNMILGDLCRNYDLEIAAKTKYGTFNPGLAAKFGMSLYGSGPYDLPSDFLRMKDDKSFIWNLLGVPYIPIPCDLSEFDSFVQQPDIQSYPYVYATDVSIQDAVDQGQANVGGAFYVYAPPSGTYEWQMRYYSQMADIATPESSAVVPWFPHQGYLHKKLSAFVMGMTGDDREEQWHTDADGMLDGYLTMKDNRTNRSLVVKMDRRYYSNNLTRLKNTKTVGW